MDTTHSFAPSKLNQSLCAVCYRTADLHSTKENEPTCESCNNTGVLTKLNDVWMCESCHTREVQSLLEPRATTETVLVESVENINKEIERDHRPTDIQNSALNKLGSQSISRSEDFFNARTTAISERWKAIVADDTIGAENKHYQLAREVREHYLHMKQILFQAVEVQLECASNQRADQVYLNQLASKLREEERTKLHLQNLDYEPPKVPKSAPKTPRLSKDDKIAADYARIMNIPIETARRLIGNKLKEVVGDCTCKETPGICKLHSKG